MQALPDLEVDNLCFNVTIEAFIYIIIISSYLLPKIN